MFLCLVFLMLSRLFIAALWSPAGRVLTSWLLFVMFMMFIVFWLLSHVVTWVRCGYRFLIFIDFLALIKMLRSAVQNVIKCVLCYFTRIVTVCQNTNLVVSSIGRVIFQS